LSLFYLTTEIGRSHAVGLVADDEVLIGRCLQFCFQFVRPRRHVEADDETVLLHEWIAGDGSLNLIASQDFESEAKLLGHFVQPLLDKTSGRDNETALKITADLKFP
jgi:hypothetical protein